ncbi:MAG TPA: lysophospholipid acyltransferase family protein [Planctomycetaceae bacterium]|nr:lysophospholipid acyltransferase family protein [Planctomycetaceae bacterium]
MKIRSRLLTKVIVFCGVTLIRLLFKTCRLRVVIEAPGTNPYELTGERRYLYSAWHDQILMVVFGGRPQKMAGLVSGHQDGSYLADAMKLVGIAAIRGSSKRGGSRAMGELLQRAREFHVAITPDGPRGPRHKIKPGIVFLASHSGRAIIPTAYACSHGWRIRGNWTDMMIPWPFTTIHGFGGPLFFVPPGIERDELERYVERLEAEMQRLEALAAESAAPRRSKSPPGNNAAAAREIQAAA